MKKIKLISDIVYIKIIDMDTINFKDVNNIKNEVKTILTKIEDENKISQERKNEYHQNLDELKKNLINYQIQFDEMIKMIDFQTGKKQKNNRFNNLFNTIVISFFLPIGFILLTEFISLILNKV